MRCSGRADRERLLGAEHPDTLAGDWLIPTNTACQPVGDLRLRSIPMG